MHCILLDIYKKENLRLEIGIEGMECDTRNLQATGQFAKSHLSSYYDTIPFFTSFALFSINEYQNFARKKWKKKSNDQISTPYIKKGAKNGVKAEWII